MSIIDKIKDNLAISLVAVVFSIITFLLFFSWKSIVKEHIQPYVVEQLLGDGYLLLKLKDNDLVSTDSTGLTRQVIVSKNIIDKLMQGEFVRSEQLSTVAQNNTKAVQEIHKQVDGLKSMNVKLQLEIERLSKNNEQLDEFIQVLATRRLKVELFVSNQKADKGKIVLNINNPVVANALENNTTYKVYASNGEYEKLTTRIERTSHPERSLTAAIGRVYIDDYHDLFDGARNGVRFAEVALK